MSRSVNTWSCARCGTAAFADQNFCRKCGTPREGRRLAPITSQVPIIRTGIKPDVDAAPAPVDEPSTQNLSRRPISLFTLFLVVVVFLALGGAVALVVNDVRNGSPQNPTVPAPGTVSSRPPGTTQPPTTSTLPTTSTTESPTTTAAPTTTQEPPTTIAPTTIAPTTIAPTTVAPATVTAVSPVTSTIPG